MENKRLKRTPFKYARTHEIILLKHNKLYWSTFSFIGNKSALDLYLSFNFVSFSLVIIIPNEYDILQVK